MRRIDSLEDHMNDIVRFELGDGKRIAIPGHDYRAYGMANVVQNLRESGHNIPTERQPVFQDGRHVGTLPAMSYPSSTCTFFYKARPQDWKARQDGNGWDAHSSLGQGDLSAVDGFVWCDDPARVHKDKEDDRRALLQAIGSLDIHPR